MVQPNRAAVEAYAAGFTDATRVKITGEPFCFGDSPEMADRLAALVLSGPKRATAAAVAEYESESAALPVVGEHAVVHDGSGLPTCVIRTDQVTVGPLDEVIDPAFAWDEGEGDRTYEDWLAGHEDYWRRTLPGAGLAYRPDLPLVLERFSVVWPKADETDVLARRDRVVVREVGVADRDWLAETIRDRWGDIVVSRGEVMEPGRLPGLVAVDGEGRRVGALTFRPRQSAGGGLDTEVVTVDAMEPKRGVGSLLLAAIVGLARLERWRRLWLITTNDNTPALRFYQRAGWELVALHANAVTAARQLKPAIPERGVDGVPIRHELELEYPLS